MKEQRTLIFPVSFGNGAQTAAPKEQIANGELTSSRGGWYPTGFGHIGIQKILGRSEFGAPLSGTTASGTFNPDSLFGIFLSQFSTAQDQLVAYANSGYYVRVADPDISAPSGFVLLASGALVGGEFQPIPVSGALFGAHMNNRVYLVNGAGSNMVIEDDLTVRSHGMNAPRDISVESWVKSPASSGSVLGKFPTGHLQTRTPSTVNFWQDIPFAYDTTSGFLDGTYALGFPQVSGGNSVIFSGFQLETGLSGLYFNVDFQVDVVTPPPTGGFPKGSLGGGPGRYGGFQPPGSVVPPAVPSYQFQYSLDAGAHFSGARSIVPFAQRSRAGWQFMLPSGTSDTSGIQFRIDILCNGTTGGVAYQLKVFGVKLLGGRTGFGDPSVDAFTTRTGMSYGITEYDSVRDLESPAWTMPSGNRVTMDEEDGDNSIKILLPANSVNSNTDKFRVYRTPDDGISPQDLGLIAEVEYTPGVSGFLIDTFKPWDSNSQPFPKYPLLRVVESDGQAIYFDINRPPVNWSFITHFQGSLVGIDANDPRKLWYTPGGAPEKSPVIYSIDNFPMDENDTLVGASDLAEVLIVFTTEAVLSMRGLPVVQGDGIFNISPVNKIQGQPGCVGRRAFCTLARDGTPAAAWVSPFGIRATNGDTAVEITDDIDWEGMVNQNTLYTSVLRYDQMRQMMWFFYDSDGDAVNDSYALFHMRDYKNNNAPRITYDHVGRITDFTQGSVNGTYRMYSSHPTDGHIYLEWSGTVDASEAASGLYANTDANVVPLDIRTGRYYRDAQLEDLEVFKASLRHSDWGVGETASVSVIYGRDARIATSGMITKNVSLAGYGGTEFLVGRSMEWLEIQIQHLSSGTGSINDIRTRAAEAGQAGGRS